MRYLYLLFAFLPACALAEVLSVPGSVPQTFVGQSSDTKPVQGLDAGAVFMETDTLRTYRWAGGKQGTTGQWVQMGDGVTLQSALTGEQNALAASEGVLFTADGPWDWEVIAASQTDSPCGTTGGVGDYLHELIMLPATTAAGAVSLEDGTGTNYVLHPGGGTTALTVLAPIVIPLGLVSTLGAWEVTTGANVTVICKGKFDVQ